MVIVYDEFPVISGGKAATPEFLRRYNRDITVIRGTVAGVEVDPHTSQASLKAVLWGRESYAFGRRMTWVTPGAVLMCPSGVEYGSRVNPGELTRSLSIHFPAAQLRAALELASRNFDGMVEAGLGDSAANPDGLAFPPFHVGADRTVRALLARLSSCTDEVQLHDAAMDALDWFAEQTLVARRQVERIPAARASVRKELFRRVAVAREAIRADVSHGWTLGQLAEVACLSPFHLQRVFKAAFGTTPMSYLQEQRLVRAKELLLQTQLPVSVIGRRVGFSSASAFGRRFRLVTAQTPAVFRRAS